VNSTEHAPLALSVHVLPSLTAAPSVKLNVMVPAGVSATPLEVLLTVALAVYRHTGMPLYDELAEIDTEVLAAVIVNDNGDEVLAL
jgi:hypothetical protein